MRRFKQPLLLALVFLGVFIIAFFSSIPFLVRSEYLKQLISQTIRTELGYIPSFQRLRVSFFPTPVLHIDTFELKPSEASTGIPLIRAEGATFRLSILSFLFGKPELAHVVLKGAVIHYPWRDPEGAWVKTVSLNDVSLDLWNIRSNRPIRFKVRGKLFSDSENVSLAGTVQADFKAFRAKDFVSKIQVSVGPIELSRLAAWWGISPSLSLEKGTLSFSGQVNKGGGTSALEVRGSSKVQGLVYQLSPKLTMSLPADYQARFQTAIDLDSGALTLKEGTLLTPFGGPFDIEGSLNVFKATADEIFVKTKALRLEALAQYVPAFEKILPINLGFSGESQFDFFAKGDPALFLINLRMDLTETTLAYSKYFSKPTGVPFLLRSDMKLAGGRAIRGDFSLAFEKAVLKGSLVGLDLLSGDGEVTVLTNKFNIDGWQQYFPPLRQFELSGDVKILTSIKGNLNRLADARVMTNVSFDGLEAKAANGAQIRNVNGSIDFGPLDSELKDIHFEIGNSAFSVEGKMFRQPGARWLVGVETPRLDGRDFVGQLRKVSEAIQVKEMGLDWDVIEESIKNFVPSGELLEQFDAQLAFGEGRVMMPRLRFRVYGGAVSARAVFDYSRQVPAAVVDVELDGLNFARMQSEGGTKQILDGNLFAVATLTHEGPFDHQWLDRLKGKGSVSVTNGEFRTLDILGGLGEIVELGALGRFKSGATRFSDIRGDFQVKDKKIETENLLLVADDFYVEGAGDVNFGGNLNFRLSVYLAPILSQKISSRLAENTRLGPIPILVVGPMTQPSIRRDPMLIRTFLESLVREQFSRITSRLAPPSSHRPTLPLSMGGGQTSQAAAGTKESASLEQTLFDSGFNLLEHFLSGKKSSS